MLKTTIHLNYDAVYKKLELLDVLSVDRPANQLCLLKPRSLMEKGGTRVIFPFSLRGDGRAAANKLLLHSSSTLQWLRLQVRARECRSLFQYSGLCEAWMY
jgi:hypothetical protein